MGNGHRCFLSVLLLSICREYNADGLRIDAAQLLPESLTKYLMFKLRQDFPGKLIFAEINPFEPEAIDNVRP